MYLCIVLGFEVWKYAQLYPSHSDFSSLFQTLKVKGYLEEECFAGRKLHSLGEPHIFGILWGQNFMYKW